MFFFYRRRSCVQLLAGQLPMFSLPLLSSVVVVVVFSCSEIAVCSHQIAWYCCHSLQHQPCTFTCYTMIAFDALPDHRCVYHTHTYNCDGMNAVFLSLQTNDILSNGLHFSTYFIIFFFPIFFTMLYTVSSLFDPSK